MSATLAALVHELDSSLRIAIIERLDDIWQESSQSMNNAGTGHAGLCELNYTTQNADWSIDITKASAIMESFEVSKQFWAYLQEKNYFPDTDFIHSVPHCSFVIGEKDSEFLARRHKEMIKSPLFDSLVYSQDPVQITQRMPLIMQGRDMSVPLAASYSKLWTDIDFGKLSRYIFDHLVTTWVDIYTQHEVRDISKIQTDRQLHIHDRVHSKPKQFSAKFVFIGAWGWALPLLQKSGIPEAQWFAGFPVDGQRLVCNNPAVIAQHTAKVYGQAAFGSPPMSVPHLDTRIIDSKKQLLFGPYAWWTTKFLKQWSIRDLFTSIRRHNIIPMLTAGAQNLWLTTYLLKQSIQTQEHRMEVLRVYFPQADEKDRQLQEAGKRVQIIKKHPQKWGILQFGTELVTSADGSIAALLGASPGASTAVSIMLTLLEKSFPTQMKNTRKKHITTIIPSYGLQLADHPDLLQTVRKQTSTTLRLDS
jgi:malate dehydrogenase (quinone)